MAGPVGRSRKAAREDPSAKRLGTYQSKPAQKRGPTVTSKADVKKQLKAGAKKVVSAYTAPYRAVGKVVGKAKRTVKERVGKTLLPVGMRGSAAPLERAAGFLGMRVKRAGVGKARRTVKK